MLTCTGLGSPFSGVVLFFPFETPTAMSKHRHPEEEEEEVIEEELEEQVGEQSCIDEEEEEEVVDSSGGDGKEADEYESSDAEKENPSKIPNAKNKLKKQAVSEKNPSFHKITEK